MTGMNDTEQLSWVRGLCASGEAKNIRTQAGVSPEEIARDVGCAAPTVYRWENGLRSPKGEIALKYAQVMRRLDRLNKPRVSA
jgi:transcriptional regulator with XRE-family HTH domain